MKDRIVLIKNAQIVNEGTIFSGDILIENEYIKEIANSISAKSSEVQVFDAENNYVLPVEKLGVPDTFIGDGARGFFLRWGQTRHGACLVGPKKTHKKV